MTTNPFDSNGTIGDRVRALATGIISLLFYGLNTLFWCMLLFAMTLLKIVIPWRKWRKVCNRVLNGIAESWIGMNNLNQKITSSTRWDVQGVETLNRSDWYLVLANHQSWVDILVLQRIFNRKIPFLKFFIKKELIWFPVLGQAWWALDFPFIKRYSKSFIKKNPHLKGKDLEITRQACVKFKTIPVSVMNFVEGTRFTHEKREHQRSPYDHLLKTKAGGIAFVLGAMGDQIGKILDVTIVYPGKDKSFWSFVCGKIKEIKVRVRVLSVEGNIVGDYQNDRDFRRHFQKWLNELWDEKDRKIRQLISGPEGESAI